MSKALSRNAKRRKCQEKKGSEVPVEEVAVPKLIINDPNLVPAVVSKPYKEYEDFDVFAGNDNLDFDYNVSIHDLSQFLKCEVEFLSRRFPFLENKYIALIKFKLFCGDCHLFIRFERADNSPEEIQDIKPNISTFIKDETGKYGCANNFVFPFAKEVKFGGESFVHFCTLSYEKLLKNALDPNYDFFTLGFMVKDDFAEERLVTDGTLLWKVNLSPARLNQAIGVGERELELARTPFLYIRESGLRLQIRLFRDLNDSCKVQVRVLNKKRQKMYHNVIFDVFHPVVGSCGLNASFNFAKKEQSVLEKAQYYANRELAKKNELLRFIDNDKLQVQVKIFYP